MKKAEKREKKKQKEKQKKKKTDQKQEIIQVPSNFVFISLLRNIFFLFSIVQIFRKNFFPSSFQGFEIFSFCLFFERFFLFSCFCSVLYFLFIVPFGFIFCFFFVFSCFPLFPLFLVFFSSFLLF